MRSPKSPAMALAYCVAAWLFFSPWIAFGLLVALFLILRAAIRYRPDEPVLNVDAMRQAGGLPSALHVVPDEVTL